ncbi:TPA: transposase, partial [Streptococcus suis]
MVKYIHNPRRCYNDKQSLRAWLKQKVLRLYLEEGRTKKSLTEEYNLGQGTLTYWLQQYRKECDNSPTKREESDSYEVAKKLRKEIEELKKENDFLKKAA